MTKLILVRHGETVDEETKPVFKGISDIPLSAKGLQRMAKAASFLSRFPIDVVYTSALSRSIESGKIISNPHGLDVKTTTDLNELHFGLWEGLAFDEIQRSYPEEFSLWLKDPETHSPPQGELLKDVQQRAGSAFNDILTKHRGQTIALVAHAGILRIILASLLELNLSRIFRISQDYGCINIVDVHDDDIPVIKLLNFTYYMER
jgi:alpha-ribazole phosphatase